jgi:7,8-dihydropterin-6-yl-methyl-4-(beta-D-ribofuranosyl)aminobenzene 5'-phosphate synthase
LNGNNDFNTGRPKGLTIGGENMTKMKLRELERVEITILVDNYTDLLLLQSTNVVKRSFSPPPQAFLAEHGFSCLIKTVDGPEEHVFLMDVGISGTALLHNAEVLKSDLSKVEALILSHGHFDHFWGLPQILPRLPKGIPVVLDPDAFLPRRINFPALKVLIPMPSPDEKMLREAGVEIRKVREDSILASGRILILGEIDRVTDFEKGMPGTEAQIKGEWVKDPFLDDRGIAVQVKNKGLVVIGGCSHAEVINTVKHAQKVTGARKVYAVLGGFHLTGPMMEPVIEPTIRAMKDIGPDYIFPTHCTGWRAINQFAREMSEQFILNTVGTTYIFG